MTFELSPAARCYEFEVPNLDGPVWRWLVLDTVTVTEKQKDERDAPRLALRLGAPAPYVPVSRTEWVTTMADSIDVLTLIAVPGYTLAETREGLAGTGWLVSDLVGYKPEWRTRLRRIACAQLARKW